MFLKVRRWEIIWAMCFTHCANSNSSSTIFFIFPALSWPYFDRARKSDRKWVERVEMTCRKEPHGESKPWLTVARPQPLYTGAHTLPIEPLRQVSGCNPGNSGFFFLLCLDSIHRGSVRRTDRGFRGVHGSCWPAPSDNSWSQLDHQGQRTAAALLSHVWPHPNQWCQSC